MDQMRLLAPFLMLALLGLIVRHPIAGVALAILVTAWLFLKWAGKLWLEAFFLSKGVKAAHVLRDLKGQPQPRESTREFWSSREPRFRQDAERSAKRT
jgi:hypothetical protein